MVSVTLESILPFSPFQSPQRYCWGVGAEAEGKWQEHVPRAPLHTILARALEQASFGLPGPKVGKRRKGEWREDKDEARRGQCGGILSVQ